MTGARRWASGAGLLVGPILWAVNMQAGQILPYSDCGASFRSSFALSAVSAVLAVGAGWASWRGCAVTLTASGRFMAGVGCLAALVFAFALIMQAVAGVVLTGCER